MADKTEKIVINCLNQEEKIEYLKKISKKYNYPNEIINYYKNSEYKICDGIELKKIKTFDNSTIRSLINLMEKYFAAIVFNKVEMQQLSIIQSLTLIVKNPVLNQIIVLIFVD